MPRKPFKLKKPKFADVEPKPLQCPRCMLFRLPVERRDLGFPHCLPCTGETPRVVGCREFGHKGESTINIFPGELAAEVRRVHHRNTYGSNMRKFR